MFIPVRFERSSLDARTCSSHPMAQQHFLIRLTFERDALGFPVITADEFLDAVEETLFDVYEGDVTPSFRDGFGYLECDIEAPDLDTAAHRVAADIFGLPLGARRLPLRELVLEGA